MATQLRVLMLEDQEAEAFLIERALRNSGFDAICERVEAGPEFLACLDSGFDIILSAYVLPDFDALRALDALKSRSLDIPLIIVAGSIGEDLAVAALQQGAADYLLKDQLGRLGQAVERALQNKLQRDERRRADAALRECRSLSALNADIGLALARSNSLEDMLKRCTESMVHNLDAAFARIWTLNEDENILELQASAGMYTHLNGPHGRIPVGKLKIGLIAQKRCPLLTNGVIGDPRVGDQDWARENGMVSFAGYPLFVNDRLIGVVAMFGRKPFSESMHQVLGSVADIIAVGIDRRRAECTLRDREEQLRQLAENISEVFWMTDINFKEILYVSPAFETIWGFACDALYQNPYSLLETISPEDRPVIECAIQNHRCEAEFSHEFRIERPDGSLRWICTSGFPVRNSRGEIYRVCGVAQDITERKKLEDQLRQAQKLEAVGKLAGGIAHDFNNLMTVVSGYSEFVYNGLEMDNPLREDVQEIKLAGERAVALTRQLLAFSRKQLLSPEVLDLNDVVSNLENMLRRLIGEDIELVTFPDPRLPRIKADPGQIQQIIMNLAVNSRDAMPNGGRLMIETASVYLDQTYSCQCPEIETGDYAMLAISDNGVGMDAETQARAFEPFFTTKEPGKGTGLGLSTVYGIVRQSGGTIRLYSEPGRGAIFKIYFPHAEISRKAITPLPISPAAKPGCGTILLVEDEDQVRVLARRILEGNGYHVLEARNGNEALKIARQQRTPLDLLLTDMIMPQLSGRALAEQLKRERPDLKVLYMSGYTENFAGREGILDADVTLLEKPFSRDGLLWRVRSLLDEAEPASSTSEVCVTAAENNL